MNHLESNKISDLEEQIELLGVKDLKGLENYLNQVLKENGRDMEENPYTQPPLIRIVEVDTPTGVYHFKTVMEAVAFIQQEHPKCSKQMVYRALNGQPIYNETINIKWKLC